MRHLTHNPKTVILVGMGPSIQDLFSETLTQEMIPEHHDEVWVINMVANLVRHDVVFWMDDLKSQFEFRPGLIKLLARYGTPVISAKAYPDLVPNSYDFPIQEVSEIGIPLFGKPYLNNGVAMAVAYAIHRGVKNLKIYGCDFTYPNRDYAESGRACVEAWISIACQKGMNIGLAPHTSLFDMVKDGGIYGYTEQPQIKMPDGRIFTYAKPDTVGAKFAEATTEVVAPVGAPPPQAIEAASVSAKVQGDSGMSGGWTPEDTSGRPPEIVAPQIEQPQPTM